MCFQGEELLQQGIVQYSEVTLNFLVAWGRGQNLSLFRNDENYALRLWVKARQIIKGSSRRRRAMLDLPIACGVGRGGKLAAGRSEAGTL